jgi:two-component system catabolic regulation response regulator CreB
MPRMAGPENPQDASVILVVEDEPDIALILRLMLEQGHIVTCVGDLAQAREAYRRGLRFDLVILDVGLPDGNGLDLCRELKATYPALPVLVLTAHPEREVWRDAERRGCGADAVLPKPFDPDRLDRAVTTLLTRPSR